MGSFRAPEPNDSKSIIDQQGDYSGALLRTQRSMTITLTNVCHSLILLPKPRFLLCMLFYMPHIHTHVQARPLRLKSCSLCSREALQSSP